MKFSDEHVPAALDYQALLILLVAVSAALGWILLPFGGTIMWGAIVAMLFKPLYRWLLPRLWRRATPAALLTSLVVVLVVFIPLALVTVSLAREAAVAYQRIESGEWNPGPYLRGVFLALPAWMAVLLDRFGVVSFEVLQLRLTGALAQGSQFIAAQALSFGQDTFDFVARLFIMLYLVFFLIRDGDRVAEAIQRALPLSAEHKRELFDKFATVIRATVKGNLLVAVIQGTLGGLAFWFLGVGGALLFAVLMAFLSLLPAVGAGLVWLPVALWLCLTGAVWQGMALIAWGVLVIGLVDNLLRPILVGKDTLMPDYVVMITTLGGMAVFGIKGFVMGPLIAAMFIAVWHIYVLVRLGEQPGLAPPGGSAEPEE